MDMIIVRVQCASTGSASGAILKNWQALLFARRVILRLSTVLSVSQLATASSSSLPLPLSTRPLFVYKSNF